MSRRTVAAGILLAWFGALGWLVRREYWPSRRQVLAEATLSLPPGASYYTLTLGGRHIGFASSTVDTLPEGLRVQEVMQLEIPALGATHHADATTQAMLSRQLSLRTFTATLRGDAGQFTARGAVSGDTLLTVDLESGGTTQQLRTRLDRAIVLPGLLPLQVTFGNRLRPGNRFNLRIFDPLTMAERDVAIRVVKDSTFIVPDSAALDSARQLWVPARWDTLHAWRVEQNVGGIELAAWIDDLGRIVQASSPVGFTMERTAFELAHDNLRRPGVAAAEPMSGDIINQTAIASNVSLEPRELRTLAVRLRGIDLTGFDLAGGRQAVRGDTLIVRAESDSLLRARYRLPDAPASLANEIHPEPLIQSTDPRIQAQARQIVGRTRDPRRVAELLTRWVYENLKKEITISVPSAVQVLETRRGDCNEHTVLFVALARALGLPARTAAGVVYLRGQFYYHAWPEVYLNGWVAVDPTFGQFPADAAHLRFTIGGLARQVELIRLIGRLNLEVTSP